MRLLLCYCVFSVYSAAVVTSAGQATADGQLYEVRSYLLGEDPDDAAIDQFLSQALLPALERQKIGPVGVFGNSPSDQSGSPRLVVIIPYDNAAQLANVKRALAADLEYQAAAKDYLSRAADNPPYQRITSELLIPMDSMPKLKVPEGTTENSDRVYELRLYESPNERLGDLKVDMFNSGEVDIFFDCGIQPVFLGQCILGPQAPSLTYLTVYPNEEARLEAWKAFRTHKDWQVMKVDPKYQGTVSKIDKYVLLPKPYSQM